MITSGHNKNTTFSCSSPIVTSRDNASIRFMYCCCPANTVMFAIRPLYTVYSARALVKKTQEPGIKLQKADFFRNDTWTSPQTNSEDAPKIPLVHFF